MCFKTVVQIAQRSDNEAKYLECVPAHKKKITFI